MGNILKLLLKKIGLVLLKDHDKLSENSYSKGMSEGEEQGYQKGYSKGFQQGKDEGVEEGKDIGLKVGYETGYNDQKITTEYRRLNYEGAFNLKYVDYIFKPYEFEFAPDILKAIKNELSDKTGVEPHPNQWEMILSKCQNTYVIAGAGSGKSTSLVNRIIVLGWYLKIPLNRITVFTFTKESRKDLINKLYNSYIKYDRRFKKDDAERIVRTFHSKIYSFGSSIGMVGSSKKLFEFYGQKEKEAIEEYGVDAFYSTDLKDKQLDILKTAYRKAFNENETFKYLIVDLLKKSIKKIFHGDEKKYEWEQQWKQFSDRDKNLASFLQKVYGNPQDFTDIIKFTPMAGRDDLPFYSNGEDPILECYIVFTPDNDLLTEEYQKQYHLENYNNEPFLSEKSKYPHLIRDTRVRERFLSFYSEKSIAFICDQEEFAQFKKLSRWAQNYEKNKSIDPPLFDYMLEGEIHPNPIYLAFYSAAQFIESMGLEVLDIKDYIAKSKLSDDDKIFADALIIYWEYFKKELIERGLTRFHNLFEFFSETDQSNFKYVLDEDLDSMTHILIDEFQDISPEMVMWLRGVLKAIKTNNRIASLMCVGDDWQAVYAWRGSAPRYFLEYENHFRSIAVHGITMPINYRCYQDLINKAEKTLERIDNNNKSKKKGESARDSYEFTAEEFTKQKKNPLELCMNIQLGSYEVRRISSASPIEWLNDQLHSRSLHSVIAIGKPNFILTDEIQRLKLLVSKYKDIPFNDLSHEKRETIIKLNRLMVERVYPQQTPIRTINIKKRQPTLEIIKDENEKAIKNKIDEILSSNNNDSDKILLLILTRTKKKQKPFKEYAKKYSKIIKILTYHSSKGLQAPYCILIGDCFYKGKADFKNLVHHLAQYNQDYDDSQRDEAMRLAYVALTRAEEKCFWYVWQKQGGAAELLNE